MIVNRKYGVLLAGATLIRIPLLKAFSDDFAAGGDWTPVAGDVKISKDGAAEANIGTLPAYTNGAWEFVLSATEMQAKQVVVQVRDAATKAVQDDGLLVETFGNASAMFPDDLTLASSIIGLKKNTAKNAFPFCLTDSTNHLPVTGKAVTAQRRIDGGAFAACANAVTEIGSGWYTIDLAATDLNGDTIALKFTAAGTDQLNISVLTST